jgi:hypothetical protein
VILTWAEATAVGHFMRESGPWTYAIVNVGHVLAVAALFGSVLVLDLRLLGLGRRVPLADVSAAVVPVAGVALLAALPTGFALLATRATDYIDNPFVLIKFPAIALGLLNVAVLNVLPGWKARASREPSASERRQLAVLAAISLASWTTAFVCGRMIGYW